jgi:hypothetical protein
MKTMKRNVLALALGLGLTLGIGCGGFGEGINHAVTGATPAVAPTGSEKTGYDLGVIIGNVGQILLSYGLSYLVHGQGGAVTPGKTA